MNGVDYSLYLVTGRTLLPPGKDYLESLEESIRGGVTVVQVREKDVDTREAVCDKYNVAVLINDRVDVALATGADGVHLGQTDMTVDMARKLLPPGSIIGVSCNNVAQVEQAVLEKVDYIGVGAVWGTQTKKLTSPIIGVRGVGAMLKVLDGTGITAVAIGGIKSTNLLRTLHGCVSITGHALDGVAVVSDIVASPEPGQAASKLRSIFKQFNESSRSFLAPSPSSNLTVESILDGVVKLMTEIRKVNPLVHQITNAVVTTQSANVTLAVGASPIMATAPSEMEDMTRICGALLVNIGTLREENLNGMLLAGTFANSFRKPVVFDPVGVGASAFRKGTVKTLLDNWQASVIKGNAGELAALAGTTEVESKGVDSVGSGFKDPETFVRNLARRERCVVVLTGPTDYISDGASVVVLQNGVDVLGKITGAGCILGSIIGSFCATAAHTFVVDEALKDGTLFRGDMLTAAVAGVLVLTIAAELSVTRACYNGPGSFLPGLIDELWSLEPALVQSYAKITVK
ncbi:hypothetical protein NLJ89_g3408 [Agrocybe chaxingu]|uniref:Thiamine phosphate synthase/TenI domain-containing protein n=1 Tax=Agrocybe chaxingu TaxID=84603 RepID=A0A9W8K2J1_9AGAR|nr:hypothetical protein NLJ89_g3408 [Agrocybe chaxingu]